MAFSCAARLVVARAGFIRGWLLLMLLVAASGNLLAADQAHIRHQLAAIVAVFNAQARDLDTTDPASLAYLNGFIATTLSQHWDTAYMAQHLLGDANYASLDTSQQQQLRQTLETTFYRYAYEVIDEYKQAPMVLGENFETAAGLLRIKLQAKGPWLPAITGNLYLLPTSTSWAIVDAGYGGLTYNMLKRNSYQRRFARLGFAGLLSWLNEKNQRFFADYCAPGMVEVMPEHIAALYVADGTCQMPES